MRKLFNKGVDDVTTLKIVIDALIGVLVGKKVLKRDDIQKQIIKNAQKTEED